MKCTNFVTTDCLQNKVAGASSILTENYGDFTVIIPVPPGGVSIPALSTPVDIGTAGTYTKNSCDQVSTTGTSIILNNGGVWMITVDLPLDTGAGGSHDLQILVSATPPVGPTTTQLCGSGQFFSFILSQNITGGCLLTGLADGTVLNFEMQITTSAVGFPINIGNALVNGKISLFRLGN